MLCANEQRPYLVNKRIREKTMDIGKIIALVPGFAGYVDREKSDFKSFIKDNAKFSLTVGAIISSACILLIIFKPDLAIDLLMQIVILIQR